MFEGIRDYDYSKLDTEPLAWELNIPSGVMVVANDLRPQFDFFGDFDIGTQKGLAQTTLAMAEIGCSYAFVGNTCPGVYKIGYHAYTIASSHWCEDTEKETLPDGEQVASITTDLWWYSIVDKDEFLRRFPESKLKGVDLVSVKPGVYRFEHYMLLRRDFHIYENPAPFVFTRIEWVRPSDPHRDFLVEIASQHFTAGQVIWQLISDYPGLYLEKSRSDTTIILEKTRALLALSENEDFTNSEEWKKAISDVLSEPCQNFQKDLNIQDDDAIQKAVNQIFCVCGGGGDWHPNGFIQFNPLMTAETPSVKIPKFDKCYHWSGLHEYCNLAVAVGLHACRESMSLSKSFYDLALNVLDCIILHGCLDYTGRIDLAVIPVAKEYRRRIVERFGKEYD